MTRAFNEGLVRLQNYMGGKTLSDAQFFAVLNADVVEMIDGENSTTEMLAEGAVTSEKIASQSIDNLKLANGSVSNRTLQKGSVTSEKLAYGLDVSGLFFIIPKGTKLPYTLTEDDKKRLANAFFIIMVSNSTEYQVFSRRSTTYVGNWYLLAGHRNLFVLPVSETSIGDSALGTLVPTAITYTSQTLTAEQKTQARENIGAAEDPNTQARANIGAAEDPNTPGDSPATLEEPIL